MIDESAYGELKLKLEQVIEENCQLKEENTALKKENEELKRRLALYENANVPPSQRRYPSRPRYNGGGKRFSGRPKGYPGRTRPVPKPNVVKAPEWGDCPACGAPLPPASYVGHHIIEEISNPSPKSTIDFLKLEGDCEACGAHVIARHPDCPPDGRFGKNVLIQTTLMKFDERLPLEKVREVLKRQYGLSITTATILDITRRVSEWLKPEYGKILQRIRSASVVYADETGHKVDGRKYWLWAFTTETETLVAIRRSRGKKVLEEILGKGFKGILVVDGWRSYPTFTPNIQRDWAHLLREAKWLAEHTNEAKPLNKALHRLYGHLKRSLEDRPPPEERAKLAENAKRRLRRWINRPYRDKGVKKFVAKVRNGHNYWFTFITVPGVEPTNNRAERALREHVVQRKIIGTFRNEKGTSIYETIMTMLATWKQRGLDPAEMLGKSLTKTWTNS